MKIIQSQPLTAPRLPATCAGFFLLTLICSLAFPQSQIPAVPDVSSPKPDTENSNASPKEKPAASPTPWQILTAGVKTDNSMRRAEAVAALGTVGPQRRVLALLEKP